MEEIWVKLYIGENDENSASVFGIYNFHGNIDQLKKEIKKEAQLECPSFHLKVYDAGTEYPNLKREKLFDPGDTVPENTTSKAPLIVVAPAPVSVSLVLNKELFIVETPFDSLTIDGLLHVRNASHLSAAEQSTTVVSERGDQHQTLGG